MDDIMIVVVQSHVSILYCPKRKYLNRVYFYSVICAQVHFHGLALRLKINNDIQEIPQRRGLKFDQVSSKVRFWREAMKSASAIHHALHNIRHYSMTKRERQR